MAAAGGGEANGAEAGAPLPGLDTPTIPASLIPPTGSIGGERAAWRARREAARNVPKPFPAHERAPRQGRGSRSRQGVRDDDGRTSPLREAARRGGQRRRRPSQLHAAARVRRHLTPEARLGLFVRHRSQLADRLARARRAIASTGRALDSYEDPDGALHRDHRAGHLVGGQADRGRAAGRQRYRQRARHSGPRRHDEVMMTQARTRPPARKQSETAAAGRPAAATAGSRSRSPASATAPARSCRASTTTATPTPTRSVPGPHARRPRRLSRRRHRVRRRLRRRRRQGRRSTSARRSSPGRTTRSASPTSADLGVTGAARPDARRARAVLPRDGRGVARPSRSTWREVLPRRGGRRPRLATSPSAPRRRRSTTPQLRSRPASRSSTPSRSSSRATRVGPEVRRRRRPDHRRRHQEPGRRHDRAPRARPASSRTAAPCSTAPTSSTSAATWTSRTCSSASASSPRRSRRPRP